MSMGVIGEYLAISGGSHNFVPKLLPAWNISL